MATTTTTRRRREVSFRCSKADQALVRIIASRAIAEGLNQHADVQGLEMDLEATHANGCPLDFAKLLGFDASNFAHDLGGIQRHLNRDTGALRRCFVPRCARPSKR